MTMKVNSKKSKQGFTILELVVALGIILTMSVSAVSVIQVQNNIYRTTLYTTEATNMAENAIECFRFAVDVDEFVETYEKTGVDLGIGENGDYTFVQSGLNVTITISDNKLDFKAVTADGDKLILEKSYTK